MDVIPVGSQMFPPMTVPEPSLLTAEEFVRLHPKHRVELIKGRVKELPMPGAQHGKVCLRFGSLLLVWADDRDCGHVMSNDSFVRVGSNPDTVVGADLIYVSYDRMPKHSVPRGLVPVPPDLITEVKSPSDLWTELFGKVVDYLKAGVRAVVVLDPVTVTASIDRPDTVQQVFHAADELTIPDVLPGFVVRVGKLFE